MKLQNIIIIPHPSNIAQEIREELTKLGHAYYSVRSGDKPYLMVATKELGQLQSIVKKYNLPTIYTSDCYRETYRLDLGNNTPTKLGKLSRATKEECNSSSFSFQLFEDGQTYYFAVR